MIHARTGPRATAPPRALPRPFYERDTLEVARDLLGCTLVFGTRQGRIVETEAYRGIEDRASHASRGPTPRSAIMYGPPGFAYVYLIYGMHHCLNVVTEPEPMPAAVLIRAVEPIAALGDASTAGPGRLCRAFGITRKENGVDLTGSPLCILPGTPPRHIATSPRVGVAYAGECATWPWRFFDPDSPCVSRTRPSVVR